MDLFSRSEINPDTMEKFERGFGWQYGLTLGIGLVLTGWGVSAWRLTTASADLAWVEVAVAIVALLPLTALAGWLAARVRQRFLLQWLVWIGWSVVAGFIVGHAPFELTSAVAGLIDPAVRGWSVFPFTSEGQFMTGVAIFLGVLAAFPAALLQVFSTDWAWERTDSDGGMTMSATAMLVAALLIGLGLGAVDDYMVNAPLDEPLLETNRVVQTALSTPPDLDTTKMSTAEMLEYMAGMPWRGRLSERFTEYLADFDPNSYQQAVVDLAFGDGFILRCQTTQYGKYVVGCYDLTAEYRRLLPQFLQTGNVACQNCTARAAPMASSWQLQHRGQFGEPTQVSVTHHAGRIVVVRADYGAGVHAECYFVGASPVVIQQCE